MVVKNDYYVFISYASKNRVHVKKLVDALTERHNVTCWFDVNDIEIDEDVFQKHILRAIRNASALVVVETGAAKQSDYVLRELTTAQENVIPIFPYKLPNSQLQIANENNSLISEQRQKGHLIQKWLKQIKIAFLATRIKFRISQPLWIAILILIGFILALGYGIFVLSKAVTPYAVDAIDRVVSDSQSLERTSIGSSEIQDPDAIAPFHFDPKSFLLADDFEEDGDLNENNYFYEIEPGYEGITIAQNEGSLILNFPAQCLSDETAWACETEINTDRYQIEDIQYFAFRLRSLKNSNFKELSLSISTTSPERRRTGFGWAISDHITPFYRANELLPETDFYAHIPLDDQWHAYEIVLVPDTAKLLYYLDGQLINTTEMKYYEEWKAAPLKFMIYFTGDSLDEGAITDPTEISIKVDQVIVGGF
jgi:hypothetical protein